MKSTAPLERRYMCLGEKASWCQISVSWLCYNKSSHGTSKAVLNSEYKFAWSNELPFRTGCFQRVVGTAAICSRDLWDPAAAVSRCAVWCKTKKLLHCYSSSAKNLFPRLVISFHTTKQNPKAVIRKTLYRSFSSDRCIPEGGFILASCDAYMTATALLACFLQPGPMGNRYLLSEVSGTTMSYFAVEQTQRGIDGIVQSLETSFQKCLCLNLLESTIKWLVKAIRYRNNLSGSRTQMQNNCFKNGKKG